MVEEPDIGEVSRDVMIWKLSEAERE